MSIKPVSSALGQPRSTPIVFLYFFPSSWTSLTPPLLLDLSLIFLSATFAPLKTKKKQNMIYTPETSKIIVNYYQSFLSKLLERTILLQILSGKKKYHQGRAGMDQ